MNLWDKVKTVADEVKSMSDDVTFSKASTTSNAETIEESKYFSKDGPSRLVKKILSSAASVFLKTSKKMIGTVVSKYQPSISLPVITSKDDIELFLKSENIAKIELIELASNNYSTLQYSNDLYEKLHNELISNIKMSENEVDNNNTSEKNLKLLSNAKFELEEFEKSELVMKLAILNLIVSKEASALDIKLHISKLDTEYPKWFHPLVLDYILNNFIDSFDSSKKMYYIEKLLTSNPLHREGLIYAEKIVKEGDTIIFKQLLDVIN